MGKGRKPCCDKAGVKKGPWSQAEDFKLISFIQKHGHNNWRALPKLAGLARCGKSCRLRWVNYLRPDLKRGNFAPQEEEAIIKLHELLGNKWSKIASHFPGRTDNEIKNVWNTHLKKRLKAKESKDYSKASSSCNLVATNAPTSHNEALDECKIEETQGTTNNDTIECSSSSSTNSFSDHSILENVDEQKDKINQDSQNELIEIPYEPNLDLWDLLHGESEVQLNDYDTPIYENDNIKEDSESWWWLVYLENELGLEHQNNESTPLKSFNNVNSNYDISSDIFSSK